MRNIVTAAVVGKWYRFKFECQVTSGTGTEFNLASWNGGPELEKWQNAVNFSTVSGSNAVPSFTPTGTNLTYSIDFQIETGSNYLFFKSIGTSAGAVYAFDNIELTPIGAVLDLPIEMGIGFQIVDQSSNDNHGTFGASSGPNWIQQSDVGKVIKVGASTANGTFLGSGFTIPADTAITAIYLQETSGTALSDFYISQTAGDESSAITVTTDIPSGDRDSLQIISTLHGSGVEEYFFNASDWGSGGTVTLTLKYELYE